MKKIYFILLGIFVFGAAFADCPTGWTSRDANPDYTVVEDSDECPQGYNEVIDPDIMPDASCDTSKGACGTSMCIVPEECN
jgi:hypothetical protein